VGALRKFRSAPTIFPIYAPAQLRHGGGVDVGAGSGLSIGVLIDVAVMVG
jgi:hypothetical protein